MVQAAWIANRTLADVPTAIAMIGAGFSGSLIAAHLLKRATQPLVIKLIERNPEIGKGVAYGTQTTGHLLNVSAGNMSAFPDDPGHLLRWLNYNYTALSPLVLNDLNASGFIPRQVFGLYIQSILEEAEATASSQVRLERVIDEVVALDPAEAPGKKATLSLRSGRILEADRVVLALRNAPSAVPDSQNPDQPYLYNAWSNRALDGLDSDAPVLLIGTGLTMVDMVVSLRERHHRGKIYAVSRRGLFPLTHQASKPYPTFLEAETAPHTIRGLLHCIRQEVKIAATQGYDWRAVTDSLRPITQKLWQGLPIPERQRLLRHGTPYFDVHRHRIAPAMGAIIQGALDSGQLTIAAGRIQSGELTGDQVTVAIQARKTKAIQRLTVSPVLDCTGIKIDYLNSPQPLIISLREQRLIRPNILGLGLDSDGDGRVFDAQGQACHWLYTIGTARKGDLWETIAVPELRDQARHLAATLSQSLPLPLRPVAPLSREDQAPRASSASDTLLFRQFFDPESSTYTYLIGDRQTKEAVLVDTVLEQVERDLEALEDLGLTLRYCLETHIHADHITGAGQLRKQTGCQVIVPPNATAQSADSAMADGEILILGAVQMTAIATPGHTNAHLAYLINKTHVLTGDALLIRGCGRTDLQSGDAGTLYDSVTQRLFTLPDDTLVYPAHDYLGRTVSTIGEEKRLNKRLSDRTREQFITIMNNLGLSYPKKIHQAVPANQYCGDFIRKNVVIQQTESLAEQAKVNKNLAANEEIYNAYLGMYV